MPKISAYPPMTSPDGADVVPIVDVSATQTKKITLTALKEWLQSLTSWITTAMIGDLQITTAKLAGDITPSKLKLGYCSYMGSVAPTQTTTSTTPQAITGASASITVTGGALLLSLTVPMGVAAQTANAGLYINGVYYQCILTPLNDTTAKTGFTSIAAGVVPAGTYTVTARFASQNSGTVSSIQQYSTVAFSVLEI